MITAHTRQFETIVRRMVIPCDISIPGQDDTKRTLSALWDTGATSTCISEEVAQEIGLMPEDTTTVLGMENERKEAPLYSIQITMGSFMIPYIQVIGLPMSSHEHDMILGMDVMTHGDVSITNYNGKTTLSFRQPSLEKIDYSKEVGDIKRYTQMHMLWRKQGNNKCPCGSGRLWANCHGQSVYIPKHQENRK